METAKIVNEVLMEAATLPQTNTVGENESLVTSGGNLKNVGWLVSTVVNADEDSISFSVQLPGGRAGYRTDILTQFANAQIIRQYAEHAYKQILKNNGVVR